MLLVLLCKSKRSLDQIISTIYFIALFSCCCIICGHDLTRYSKFKWKNLRTTDLIEEKVLKISWVAIFCTEPVPCHGRASWKFCLFNYRLSWRFTTCKNSAVQTFSDLVWKQVYAFDPRYTDLKVRVDLVLRIGGNVGSPGFISCLCLRLPM